MKCPGGGIGRRAAFRSPCPYGCASSSLALGTKNIGLPCREPFFVYVILTQESVDLRGAIIRKQLVVLIQALEADVVTNHEGSISAFGDQCLIGVRDILSEL